MKKIILLSLVAFLGVQLLIAQTKRPTVEARVNFFTNKYDLSEEQQVKLKALYEGLDSLNLNDDDYRKKIGVINKTINTEILTEEQKAK